LGDELKIYINADLLGDSSTASPPPSGDYGQKLVNQFREMIIFENDDFLAINKPVNLAVQLGTKVSVCVETFMAAYDAAKNCSCKLVHRLDKDTSGVLLIAKNTPTARKLTLLFRENKIQKTYLAVVDGKIKTPGIIDNVMAESDQKAVTAYRPLKISASDGDFKYYTLLELKPSTGRKHQLRIHCAEVLKAPILGDKKYNKNPIHQRLFLHSYEIIVEGRKIVAPVPDYFPIPSM
jgi:23S rRNA pseudouridine955/2504/2580 synthase